MPKVAAFSVQSPPALGSWVTICSTSRRKVDQAAAQTAALVTSVCIEGAGSCTVVYPNELALRGFFRGPPLLRLEGVDLAKLRKVAGEVNAFLEQKLLQALKDYKATGAAAAAASSRAPAGPAGDAACQGAEVPASPVQERERSRSPRSRLGERTPQRPARGLDRRESEEKPSLPEAAPAQTRTPAEGKAAACDTGCKELAQTRLLSFTKAVGALLGRAAHGRMERALVSEALEKESFSAAEVARGLQMLDDMNNVMLMDDMVFAI
mmetsp:Transcript_125749/g.367468  ORF Transcript_125749/g.367468 Transcript_125749/m.367468 type:complete len:266 (+) Transcript_125749:67-864(+)